MIQCDVVSLFKQKTAYELRISDWSSDVCSSDLCWNDGLRRFRRVQSAADQRTGATIGPVPRPYRRAEAVRVSSPAPRLRRARGRGDRKRVVWGKSVS